MVESIRIHKSLLVITLAYIFPLILSFLGLVKFSVYICVVFSIVSAYLIMCKSGQLISLSLFFWVFSSIYGLSAPINVVNGISIGGLFSDSINQSLPVYLQAYILSSIGLLIGISIHLREIDHSKLNSSLMMINTCFSGAIFLAFSTTLFEFINIYRAGGFGLLFKGKAVFQATINSLSLTLPSELMFNIYGVFLGLFCGASIKKEISKLNVVLAIVPILPFLFCKILLGQRGILISFVLTFIVCYSMYNPIKKFSFKLILIGIVLYLFLMFLYVNRGLVVLLPSNPELFFEKAFSKERLMNMTDISGNEYGCTYGNFCTFYQKYGVNYKFRLGETYLVGLIIIVPSFLFPGGVKPQQIIYQFRDEFFLSEASRSSIASTGFSSILEAYMNFGMIGVLIVYFVIGCFISKFDVNKKTSWRSQILYAVLFTVAMSFSRNPFSSVFSTIAISYIISTFFNYIIPIKEEK